MTPSDKKRIYQNLKTEPGWRKNQTPQRGHTDLGCKNNQIHQRSQKLFKKRLTQYGDEYSFEENACKNDNEDFSAHKNQRTRK